MRQRSANADISVNAIAGTEVVLLGLNAKKRATRGLLGFTIYKRKGKAKRFTPLSGGRRDFEGVKSKAPIIQAFQWSDYVVNPKTTYTYRVVPIYGKPEEQREGEAVEVTIETEDPDDKTHAVYFNRGVAGSQAYSRRFGKHAKWYRTDQRGRVAWQEFVKPEDIPDRAAYKWLSRGLEEALLGFLGQATGPEYALRGAIYELTYGPAIQGFVDALERGADVKIVHHAKREKQMVLKRNKDSSVTIAPNSGEGEPILFKNREIREVLAKDAVARAADAAVAKIGLEDPAHQQAFDNMLIERTDTQISHNKFIVLLKNDQPIQVWTGSTNLTEGGIFGQSNVGHVVRDEGVAQKYYEYWQKLSTDPKKKSAKSDPPDTGMRNWTVAQQPDLTDLPPKNSMTPIFSPRLSKTMLNWYADRLDAAKSSVFFTAAFSVADEIFQKVIQEKEVGNKAYLRYLLLEGNSGLLRPKIPEMQKVAQNRIAYGDTLLARKGGDPEHKQFIETLTGLNGHVNYLHTKYMLIDPLSDDPIVITGSANFSQASTQNNDENMLIIRGNTRVADIFLGEFMRLFNHFRSRNKSNQLSDEEAGQAHFLVPNNSWIKPYFEVGNAKRSERMLFG